MKYVSEHTLAIQPDSEDEWERVLKSMNILQIRSWADEYGQSKITQIASVNSN